MEGRPRQERKGWVVDDLGAFVLVISAARRCWKTATPNMVFDYRCFLDTQGDTLRWCMNNLASVRAKGYDLPHGRRLTTSRLQWGRTKFKLLECYDLIFNILFVYTLRASSEAAVVL